jgi:hypothetical protein
LWLERDCCLCLFIMPQTYKVKLARVFTDDLEYQIWVAATSRDEAASRILDCVPDGWTARLLEEGLDTNEMAAPKLEPGEVRELKE